MGRDLAGTRPYATVLKGLPIAAGITQNHQANIDSHVSQLKIIQGGQLPVDVGQLAMAGISAHITEHHAMMMVVQIASALGIPVEMMGSMPPEMDAKVAPAMAEVSMMIAQESAPPDPTAGEAQVEQVKADNAARLEQIKAEMAIRPHGRPFMITRPLLPSCPRRPMAHGPHELSPQCTPTQPTPPRGLDQVNRFRDCPPRMAPCAIGPATSDGHGITSTHCPAHALPPWTTKTRGPG